MKTLQLERDQGQMLLENIQQRHKQDMELIENTHKYLERLAYRLQAASVLVHHFKGGHFFRARPGLA